MLGGLNTELILFAVGAFAAVIVLARVLLAESAGKIILWGGIAASIVGAAFQLGIV